MPFLAIVAAATALSATPEPQANRPGDPTRLSIQRGLDFLEKKGLNYVAEQKCAACHHVPMFFWSAHEARRSGFSPNPRVFSEVEGAALEPFLKNPKVQVNIKDGKPVYIEDKQNPSPEMVYLLASLGDELALPAEKIPGLERFLTILIESQGANGSWTLKNWKAPKHGPCYPGNDQGYTLWVLLALRTAERTSLPREMVAASRQRALDWLSKAAPTDSAQEQALLLVIYSYSGKT